MTAEYGTDIKYNGDDIFPSLELQNTDVIVLESLSRRLQSNYGSLFYDPEYGYNIANLLLSPVGQGTIDSTLVETECLKDERVHGCVCDIVVSNDENYEVQIWIELAGSETTFNLVFSLVDETLEVAYERLTV